jgi:hypothetical protein
VTGTADSLVTRSLSLCRHLGLVPTLSPVYSGRYCLWSEIVFTPRDTVVIAVGVWKIYLLKKKNGHITYSSLKYPFPKRVHYLFPCLIGIDVNLPHVQIFFRQMIGLRDVALNIFSSGPQ